MKIAIIGAKSIPLTKGGGGVERHVEEFGSRLVLNKNDVVVYVRKRSLKSKEEEYKGMTLVGLPSIFTKHLDTFTYSLIASIFVLFQKFDVIHYHGIGPATLAWIPRIFKPNAKVVVTFHSLDRFHQKWGIFARIFLRYAEWATVTFPHRTIAVSRIIQVYSKKYFKKDIDYIPNGTDIKKYPGSELIGQFGLEREKYILTTGRFAPQKGIHYLIRGYKKLDTDKKLVIVGGSAVGSDYEQYIRELAKGNSNIIFTGFQTDLVLDQLYANAYLYVHPSEAEGLSMSILEAMAAGRCVLVSDIPENIESIDHSGFTFCKTDVEDLREKIEGLFDHPEIVKEMGEKGKKWVREQYDWGGIVKKIEKVYNS